MLGYRTLATALVVVLSATAAAACGTLAWAHAYFLVNGRETAAIVTQMRSESTGNFLNRLRGRPADVWRTEYEFIEAGGQPRTGSDRVPVPSELKPGNTVRVAYIPGAGGRSMIVRDDGRLAIGCFLISAVVCVGATTVTVRSIVKRPKVSLMPDSLATNS